MFSQAFTVLLGYLAVASSRESVRPMPTITNSLVNLGKMEISFYFNGNGRDPSHRMSEIQSHSLMPPPPFIPKMDTIMEEPCPCSSLRNAKDSFLNNPTSLINKILMHNDLFSFNKDPLSSTLCCESHEHMQEGTFVFEMPANQKPPKPSPGRSNPLPMMPFLFDSVIPNKSMLPPLKTKSIEIFLFPKKKDMANVMNTFETAKFPKKKESVVKEGITVVGDKKLENNINLFKPPPPVKKESTAQIVVAKDNENEKPAEDDKILVEPASKPNAV
uniref:Uncharacterized protein n=1 Tax=Heliothis virescens TaxID=7102 RepID=A0A2A4IX40_HELVI